MNASVPQVLDDGDFRYLYGLGRIAEVDGSDNAHYYLADGLGSTMALTDDSGTVENTYVYDPFGAVTASSGSQDNGFTFTGEQTDGSTSLEYLRARYYDPATGRFLSKDPLGGALGSPLSQNKYSYAVGNPCGALDPTGLASEGQNFSLTVCSAHIQGLGIGRFRLIPKMCNIGISSFICGLNRLFRWDVLFDLYTTATFQNGPSGISLSSITVSESKGHYGWTSQGGVIIQGMNCGSVNWTFTSQGRLFGGNGIPALDPILASIRVDFQSGYANPFDIIYSGSKSRIALGQNIESECHDVN